MQPPRGTPGRTRLQDLWPPHRAQTTPQLELTYDTTSFVVKRP